jgi:hypothetical protein
LRQVVQHIDKNVAEFDHFSLRKLAGPSAFVDVPAHGRDRSNCGKLFEDVGRTDIAGVDDVVRPA